jgi:XTP/dITP diphosphohydrolase
MLKGVNELVIATKNRGKAREFAELFKPYGIRVKSLPDFGQAPEIVEDGSTFLENACKKARTVAEAFGIPALADDSGLCVDELGGAPGVYSARYAGSGATDEANNARLLAALKETAGGRPAEGPGPGLIGRGRFVCALALYDPASGDVVTAEGFLHGWIASSPRGEHGFGYDPLFYLPEYGCTLAELPMEQKNRISHRGRAIRELRAKLEARR